MLLESIAKALTELNEVHCCIVEEEASHYVLQVVYGLKCDVSTERSSDRMVKIELLE
jgi:hypothetical protein